MIVVSNHSTSKTIRVQRGLFVFDVLPMCVAAFQRLEPGHVWVVAWHSHHVHGLSVEGSMAKGPSSVLTAGAGNVIHLPDDAESGDILWLSTGGSPVELHAGTVPLVDRWDAPQPNIHTTKGFVRRGTVQGFGAAWVGEVDHAKAAFTRDGNTVPITIGITHISHGSGLPILTLEYDLPPEHPGTTHLYKITGTQYNNRDYLHGGYDPVENKFYVSGGLWQGGEESGGIVGELSRYSVDSRNTARRYVLGREGDRYNTHEHPAYTKIVGVEISYSVSGTASSYRYPDLALGWVCMFVKETPWAGFEDDWNFTAHYAEGGYNTTYYLDRQLIMLEEYPQPSDFYGYALHTRIPWEGDRSWHPHNVKGPQGSFFKYRTTISTDRPHGYTAGDTVIFRNNLYSTDIIEASGNSFVILADWTNTPGLLNSFIRVYDAVCVGDSMTTTGLTSGGAGGVSFVGGNYVLL